METYTETIVAKQVSDTRNSLNETFHDETPSLGELCDANAEALRLGISTPVAALAPSLDDEAVRHAALPAPDCVCVAPALDEFAVMPRAERATRMEIAAREHARRARAYPVVLRRDRFIRARAAFRRKAVALALKAHVAIKGAFTAFSRAARSHRTRRPAARAGKKSAAAGDGGQGDDDAAHAPAAAGLPWWAKGVAGERHSPQAWEWIKKTDHAGGGAWALPGWHGDETRGALSKRLRDIDRLKGARGRAARGGPPHPGDREIIEADDRSKADLGATGWRGGSSRLAGAFA